MVTIKIRFNSNKKGKLPTGTFEALRNEITKRLSAKYPDLNIDGDWLPETQEAEVEYFDK